MRCPREKIDRPIALQRIALLPQDGSVPRHGSRIAAYHYNAAGCHVYNCIQCCTVATLARRVKDDHIRAQSAFRQDLRCFSRICTQKFRILYPCTQGIFLGVFYGAGNNLDADELLLWMYHGKTNGANSAVEIKQRFLWLQRCQPCGFVVELLGRIVVHLIEAVG